MSEAEEWRWGTELVLTVTTAQEAQLICRIWQRNLKSSIQRFGRKPSRGNVKGREYSRKKGEAVCVGCC